ncbi:hypothetical protein [Peribacillus butanolivorans]|uniref:hypothetical protein n=1 Tax=Peribacillus butanolivorans TaxID=421767 RepID=UPI0036DAE81F
MGFFGKAVSTTDTEFTWKQNKIYIENGYLKSERLVNVLRIPLEHIETVTYCIEGVKITPELNIIGKGTVLGTLKVGLDLKDDIQDWILERIS